VTQVRKIGLVLAIFLGLVDVAFTFVPAPAGEEGAPPFFIVVLGLIVGILTVVGAAIYWRSSNRAAFWTVIGTRIISVLSGVPAFLFGAPTFILVAIVILAVITVISLVLLLRPEPAGGGGQGSAA
jgi:hypothetical protein